MSEPEGKKTINIGDSKIEKIDFSVNINNDGYRRENDEHEKKPSQPEKTDNETEKDPTHSYSITPRSLCKIDVLELENNYKLLNQEQVLLLSCYDKEVGINAVHQLISKMDSYLKRQLELKKSLKKDEDHPYRTWYKLSHKDFSWAKSTIIFLDAYHISAQLLLEELIFSHVETSNLRRDLKDTGRLIVCLVEQDNLNSLLDKNPNIDSQLALWKLDYLKPLLACEPDAEKLCQTIQAQSRQGLWGNTPKEIYANVKGYHQNGTLREYIQKLETNSKTTQNPIEIVSRSKEVHAVPLFQDSSPMEQIVLFVAVYFPNLTYEDFVPLVLFFLENQTRTKVSKKKKKKKSKKKTSSDGENREDTTNTKQIPLSDDWSQQDGDETLDKLHLKIRTGENEKEIIDFKLPYLRTDLERYLSEEKPAFLRKQADLIRYSKIIFMDNIEVLDNAIKLMVMMAKKNPTHYGRVWLFNLVSVIEQKRDNFKVDENNPLLMLISLLDEQQIKKEIQREHDLACVAEIIKKMLNHETLILTVSGFFDDLFGAEYNEVIFDLAKYLRYAPNFDELSYMRRLSHQTKDNSQFQNWIRGFLQSYLRKSGGLYDSIAKLSQWLPQKTVPHEQYQQHQSMAFNAFFELMLNATGRGELEENSYGQWPSRYLLFRALETEQSAKNIKQVMDILAHPGTEKLLQKGWSQQLEKFLTMEWLIVTAMSQLKQLDFDSFLSNLVVNLSFKKKGQNESTLVAFLTNLNEKMQKDNIVFVAVLNDLFIKQGQQNHAALLTALLMGKWRMTLQGDLKATMSPEADSLYQIILACFHQLDNQFQKQVCNYLNALKNILMEENKLLREQLREIKVHGKIATQIAQQISMRTNYLIRLRKDVAI